MTHVLLSECARTLILEASESVKPYSIALILTPEPKTGVLMVKLIDSGMSRLLKTKPIAEVLPGIMVYQFGLEQIDPDLVFEITAFPVKSTADRTRDGDAVMLGHLFQVHTYTDSACSADRISQAS